MRSPERTTRGHGTVRSEGPGKLAARMVAGDEPGAWGVVEAALASGVEAADVYLDLLVPALELVGDGWAVGELTVADEHRATTISAPAGGSARSSVRSPRPQTRHRCRGRSACRGAAHAPVSDPRGSVARGRVRSARHGSQHSGGVVRRDSEGSQPSRRDHDRDHDSTAARPSALPVKAIRQAHLDVPILVGGTAVHDSRRRSVWVRTMVGHRRSDALVAIERISRDVSIITRDPRRISSPTSPRQARMIEKVRAPEGEHVVLASSAIAFAMRRKMNA